MPDQSGQSMGEGSLPDLCVTKVIIESISVHQLRYREEEVATSVPVSLGRGVARGSGQGDDYAKVTKYSYRYEI